MIRRADNLLPGLHHPAPSIHHRHSPDTITVPPAGVVAPSRSPIIPGAVRVQTHLSRFPASVIPCHSATNPPSLLPLLTTVPPPSPLSSSPWSPLIPSPITSSPIGTFTSVPLLPCCSSSPPTHPSPHSPGSTPSPPPYPSLVPPSPTRLLLHPRLPPTSHLYRQIARRVGSW
ncbi:hypothetical protein E2C01_004726 [Portunus trituberculatus]|uniref:Uncharacterized protein n=1 Tax=Portunus trituberculatus TaxID=210409 RepID=A0A5B7CRB5_PORTR|nr:hypothetical protein [Portunus trituberculatus]